MTDFDISAAFTMCIGAYTQAYENRWGIAHMRTCIYLFPRAISFSPFPLP